MSMMKDDWENTLEGINSGIHVRHIATFNLTKCKETEDPKEIMYKKEFEQFDIIPVEDDNHAIKHIIKREQNKPSKIPVDVTMLIPAETPLLIGIQALEKSSFKLVLGNNGIEGIVTKSDLLKLPVRMLAFAHISYFEMCMTKVIREKIGDSVDTIARFLSLKRQEKCNEKYEYLKQNRLDLDYVEALDFCDKRDILKKHFKLGNEFKHDLEKIEALRNQIAHSATFIEKEEDLKDFLEKLQAIEKNIDLINRLMDKANIAA